MKYNNNNTSCTFNNIIIIKQEKPGVTKKSKLHNYTHYNSSYFLLRRTRDPEHTTDNILINENNNKGVSFPAGEQRRGLPQV